MDIDKLLDKIKINNKDKLTDKQKALIKAYVDKSSEITYNNGTQSALAAGYKASCARYQACKLLARNEIKDMLGRYAEANKKAQGYTVQILTERMWDIADRAKKENQLSVELKAMGDIANLAGLTIQRVETRSLDKPEIDDREREILSDLTRDYKVKLAGTA